MTERPSGVNLEAIFKKSEEKNGAIADNQYQVEKVNDDLSPTPQILNFITEHPVAVKTAAMFAAVGTVISSGAAVMAAAESPSAYVYQQPGSIDQKYNDALDKVLIAANTAPAKESIKTSLPKKIIFQIDKPYYMVTDPNVSGSTNLLRKNNTCPSMIGGRTMVPLELMNDVLGAKSAYDTKTKTTTIAKGNTIAKLKDNGNSLTIVDSKTNKTRTVALEVPSQKNKDGKTIVPIRAVTEIFGAKALYDTPTRSVLIGYTDKEKTDLFGSGTVLNKEMPADVIDLDATFVAFKYMVNGAKADCLGTNVSAKTDKISGAKIVLSRAQLQQESVNNNAVNQVRKNLKKGDFVYVMNGNCFAFNGEKVRALSGTNGNIKETAVTIPTNYAVGTKIKWSDDPKNSGIFFVDKNEKIIAKFTQETKNPNQQEVKEMNQEEKNIAIKEVVKHFADIYTTPDNFKNPLEKLAVGATVVYSSENNKLNEKKEVAKYQSKVKKGDVIYCMGGKMYLARQEFVYKLETFNQNKGEYQTARIKYATEFYNPNVRFDYSKNSIVASNDLKVTHDYNLASGKWEERDNYEMVGNAEQRIRKSLNNYFNGYAYDKGRNHLYNPVGLDVNEVKAYCETGDDSNCKTFQVMKNAKGEPAFFVTTSDKYGFNETCLIYLRKAVDRYNEIDPKIIDTMTNRFGLTCVTYDMAGETFTALKKRAPGWIGTYHNFSFGNIVLINQNNQFIIESSNDPIYPRTQFAETLSS